MSALIATPTPAESEASGSESTDFFCAPLTFAAAFSPAECVSIVDLGQRAPVVNAGLTRPIEKYREGTTRAIGRTNSNAWLYTKITNLFQAINQWYQYQLAGDIEGLLYCEYPPDAYFHWHLDAGEYPTGTRKITLS